MSKYQAEILALAARSACSWDDIVCEWSYNRHLYPTLIGQVRRGICSISNVVYDVARVQSDAIRDARIAGRRIPAGLVPVGV